MGNPRPHTYEHYTTFTHEDFETHVDFCQGCCSPIWEARRKDFVLPPRIKCYRCLAKEFELLMLARRLNQN